MRMWRNWQTRWVQVSVLAREWRFKSSHPHQSISLLLLWVSIGVSLLSGAPCSAVPWQTYQDTQLFRFPATGLYFYSTTRIAIDADGAPNAYHPENRGSDDLKNAGYPGKGWKSILAVDPSDPTRPFVQPSGPFAGYFVSMTALQNRAIADKTNPERYVDARRIPYIVFPGSFAKLADTGGLGDLGIAINLADKHETPFVVADIGPSKARLGEVSIRTAENLGGHNVNPRNGAGSPKGTFVYVVFARTAQDLKWPIDESALREGARTSLAAIGGWDAVTACLAESR